MMMKSKFKINYLLSSFNQLFAIIVPLFTTPYISRVLGVECIGIYSYSYSIVRYFWLLSILGIPTLGMKKIGIYQKNKDKYSEVFWNLVSLKFVLFIVSSFFYIIYIFAFSNNLLISLLQGVYLLAAFFDITWFFQGLENYKDITIRNFVFKLFNIFFIFMFIKEPSDLCIYIFGLSFFMVLGNIYMWLLALKRINKYKRNYFKPFLYFKESLQLFIPSIAVQLFAIIDKSMIGGITNSMFQSGIYEQAYKVVDMSLIFITTISTIMLPSTSKSIYDGDIEKTKANISLSFSYMLFLSIPMCLGIISISSVFVPLFFGSGYEASVVILQVLSLLYVLIGFTSITGGQCLVALGKYNLHTIILVLGGVINIFINNIFIRTFGALGAAIGSISGELFVVICELIILSKINFVSLRGLLCKILKYMFSAVIMIAPIILFKSIISNLFIIFIFVIICFIIYCLVLLLFKDEVVKNIFGLLLKRLCRKER